MAAAALTASDLPYFRPMEQRDERPRPAAGQSQSPADEAAAAAAAEDVALMLRVREGDMGAFEKLVERHQSAVIGTVAKMLGDVDEAHDIAQQVFVRVWKSAPRYEPKAKFTTWLFTITRNLVFNEMRRASRRYQVSMDEREEEHHLQTPSGAPTPDSAAKQSEFEAAIDKAIESLPNKARMAVVLRRYEDMPYDEIGKVLKLSIPAVKSLLFRARTQLRDALSDYLDGE
ncbi:MAG: sigma-70 family RNA polymerase sigma factor [Verrucomicrobiales bacterium]